MLTTLTWKLRKIERKNGEFDYQVIDGAGEIVVTRRSKRDYVACFVYASKDAEGGDKVHYAAPFFFGRPDRVGKGDSANWIKAGRQPNALALIETWRNHSRPGAWSDYPLTRTADGTPIIPDFVGSGISWYEIPGQFRPRVGYSTAVNLEDKTEPAAAPPVDLGEIDAAPEDVDPIQVIARITRPVIEEAFGDIDAMVANLSAYLWDRLEGTDPDELATNVRSALEGINIRIDYGPADNAAEGVTIAVPADRALTADETDAFRKLITTHLSPREILQLAFECYVAIEPTVDEDLKPKSNADIVAGGESAFRTDLYRITTDAAVSAADADIRKAIDAIIVAAESWKAARAEVERRDREHGRPPVMNPTDAAVVGREHELVRALNELDNVAIVRVGEVLDEMTAEPCDTESGNIKFFDVLAEVAQAKRFGRIYNAIMERRAIPVSMRQRIRTLCDRQQPKFTNDGSAIGLHVEA